MACTSIESAYAHALSSSRQGDGRLTVGRTMNRDLAELRIVSLPMIVEVDCMSLSMLRCARESVSAGNVVSAGGGQFGHGLS